jgi:hypothetical protein
MTNMSPSPPSSPIPDSALPAVRELLRNAMPPNHYLNRQAGIENNDEVAREPGSRWLAKGKYIVRYHADTESEEAYARSIGESCNEYKNIEEYKEMRLERDIKKNKKRNALGDEDFTARWVECENCGQEFDIPDNQNERPCNPFCLIGTELTICFRLPRYRPGRRRMDRSRLVQ